MHKQPLINLLRGWPNPSLLPVDKIKAASAAALSQPDVSTPGLLYGPDPGYEPLRESIAKLLTRFYQVKDPISPTRICITGGASQNLASILQVFSDPLYTKNVWLISPTYYRVCPIFENNAFHGRLRSVPEDDEGIDIDCLRRQLCKSRNENANEKRVFDLLSILSGFSSNQSYQTLKGSQPWRKVYRHIVYAVPTFANPTSRTMTLRRREQLVQVAREYDALIITDDVYDQLQWPAQKSSASSSLKHAVLPRVVDIDRELEGGPAREGTDGFGNVVSNGSFSKIAAPGVRCGWAEGTEKFAYALSQCGASASGGAPSQMTSTFMTYLIETGDLEAHICTTLQPAYARRYYHMMEAIERYLLPLGVSLPQSYRTVVGGYFLWLAVPRPLLAEEVARRAKEEENLIVGQGSLFAVYGDERTQDLERQIRVCFSWEEEVRLGEGIERLARVIRQMHSDPTTPSSDRILTSAMTAEGYS
ncbi:MAG: hypothetical protein Q9225_006024 [Loekoesia sp. 1 TL-2023]